MSPSRTSPPTVAADVQSIVQRALEQTVNGVVVTDALQPGNPIVHVNEGFTRLTGYAADEVLGHNCAFLQGTDRNQLGIGKLRVAIAMGEEVMVMLPSRDDPRAPLALGFSALQLSSDPDVLMMFVTDESNAVRLERLRKG